ncbi:MAG: dTMP kinase [Mycoplasmoidaceae bacterium]|nr:dTMP kinase [Mycoplasmoidaceae bacterium]
MTSKGLFITFEGPDGCGKTTIINLIYKDLQKKFGKNKVVLTREPGGKNNVVAEDIRNILLNKLSYNICDQTEALLFAASRAQHVKDFIIPNLKKGKIVLCDRYIHSSLVYQGYARGLGIQNV